MRKVFVIAAREYQAAVRTKAFIYSMIAMPVFFGGMFLVQAALQERVDTTDKKVAVVDLTDSVYDTIARAARERNESEVYVGEGEDRKKVRPRFLLERVDPDSQEISQLALELSERVRNDDLFAFVIIPPEIVEPGAESSPARIAYHSNTPAYDDVEDWIAKVVNDKVQDMRLSAAGFDPAIVKEATQRVPVANLGLVAMDEQGRITPAEETNKFVTIFLPFGMMMLMFMVVMVSASPLMQGVLEEKMQRIAEVLLGSVTPFELMLGKLLGIVGVSLTIASIYLLGAFYAIHRAGFGAFFPTHAIWWFVIFLAMAVLLYGAIFIAVGSAVNDLKEAQNLMTPMSLLIIVPLLVWMNVIREPAATWAVVLSFIPPFTPMLMVLRLIVLPSMPLWQPVLGAVLVLLVTVATVYVGGRIFRVGILMQGKSAGFAQMARWALRG